MSTSQQGTSQHNARMTGAVPSRHTEKLAKCTLGSLLGRVLETLRIKPLAAKREMVD